MKRFLLCAALLLVSCAPDPAPAETPSGEPAAASERAAWVGDAVIYEVFVRSFTPEGTFRAIIPRLDELKAMGVTTLWLMPIHPVGVENRKGRLGSPYAVRDYRGVEPAFGTKEDFRALVAAVHDRRMTLILDFVANHTAFDHPWVASRPDFYTRAPDGSVPTPPAGTDWTDVAELDFANPALRDSLTAAMRYWVEGFDVDGFRCDVAAEVPPEFWRDAIAELRALKPLLMLAEADEPALHAVGFDVTYAWGPFQALKAVWDGAPVDTLHAALAREQRAFPPGALRLRFVTNHDETSWDDAAVRRYGGPAGLQAALVAAYTLPGVPLVYNGQEVAAPQRLNLFEDEKIAWALNPAMRPFHTALLGLTASSRALREGTLEPVALGPDVLAFAREHDGERVLVVVNVRDRAQTVALPEAILGVAMQDVFTATSAAPTVALPPYGYRVYRGMARQ